MPPKSLCTRIKTQKKCNRFTACKYAKGTKRQYCRKRHSRRNKKA